MREINNPGKLERKAIKGDVNALSIALIGYLIITSFASLVIVFFGGFRINGIVYLISSLVGMGFIWFCYRDNFDLEDILEERREIPPKVLLNAFVCIVGLQPVFQLLSQAIALAFEAAGYRIAFSEPDPHNGGFVFVMLNAVVFGPAVEEVLFRGVALRALSRYGRNFAIVAGAILFGLYHANFPQFGHSFAAGLILGYITFRYAIKWAIVLHCMHNLLMIAVSMLDVPWFINYGFFGIFSLWAIVILIVKFDKIKRFFDKGRSLANAYKYAFATLSLLAYVAVTVFLAITHTHIQLSSEYLETPPPDLPRV
ncbi:MAG: CPBP family intramembrane metalloprotease [Clostridiales Family XIII bacterium]|jgi:membrane protease YdiL (CAAX protease family)|nr:CPBP family intramembrane metalloprotease [Clostridiales Family XIII bacterium]